MPNDYRSRVRDDSDDDDDDDRPRRRRRDDDDDRQRRRPRKPRPKKPDNPLMMRVILGVVFFVVLVVGVAIVFLVYQKTSNVPDPAKAREQVKNNMSQLGAAFNNQLGEKQGMCAPYYFIGGWDVNKELSWRVGLLPHVGQGGAQGKFNLKEAWNSPANKSASNTPIPEYTSPFDGVKGGSTNTPYRVFYGPGAVFEERGLPVNVYRTCLDGTSNTILIVHAYEQVPWAAPRDFKYDDTAPLPKLGHPDEPGGFYALLADGSVRFISDKVSEKTLRSAIMPRDGVVLGSDW